MNGMLDLENIIDGFFDYAKTSNLELYNEFSLQHEMGFYLRSFLQKNYSPECKVQFERNVSYFSPDNRTIKKEIDIAIFESKKKEKYAIELKCPINGQYPEQMYSFIKDIKFMEELLERGFTKAACVALVSGRPFYDGKTKTGIYKYFRQEHAIYGDVYKPTGQSKQDKFISLTGRYSFEWQDLDSKKKYYIIEI